MKRLVSILVVLAVLSASVLLIIPTNAEEIEGDGAILGSTLSKELQAKTPLESYYPNWNDLIKSGNMRAQWQNEVSDDKNNYGDYFAVNATESSIESIALENAEERAYYSTVDMYEINARTYYEYTFDAKNSSLDSTGHAGVIFAYDHGSKMPYFLYGSFQNASESEGVKISFCEGTHIEEAPSEQIEASPYIVKETDGFGRFKVVIKGLSAELYYLDIDGRFMSLGEPFALAEGSSVCLGVYSRGGNGTLELKNCELSAFNNESVAILTGCSVAKIALASALDVAEEIVLADYTEDTATTLSAVLGEARAAYADPDKTDEELSEVTLDLTNALASLRSLEQVELEKMKTVFLIALSAKRENTDKVFTDASYAEYSAAYDAIVAEINAIEDLNTLYLFDIAALKVAAERLLVVNVPTLDDEADDDSAEIPEVDVDADVDAEEGDPSEAPTRGCFSSISISALAIVATVGCALVLKKKD